MAGLMDQLGQVIAGIEANPVVRMVMTGALVYIVIVWLAVASWVYQDARRRHASPVAPYFASGALVMASPVLFPLALMVYRVVRPAETLSEARARALDDRLTALERAALLTCPSCSKLVDEAWLGCPACRTRLAHRCLSCGRSMALDWSACAWCATEFAQPARLDAPLVSARKRIAGAAPAADPVPAPDGAPTVNRRGLKRPQAKPARA
jgi:hypothetical protein